MAKKTDKKKAKQRKSIIILVIALVLVGAITFIVYQTLNSPFHEVVINVNGTEIKMDYLLKRIYSDGTETEETMDTIVQEEVTRQFAEAYVQISDEEVYEYEMALMEAKTGESDPAVLEGLLQDIADEAGFTDHEMEQLIFIDALSAKLNQYLIGRIQTVDEQVHLLTIIFDSESNLNNAISRLDAGEEFEDLAAELNPTEELREKKGDIGWLARSSLQDNIAASVFDEMNAGQISEPFLLDESYVLFYVVEHEEAREIDKDILESMKHKAFDDWVEYQKAMSSIKIAEISTEKESWIEWQLQKMRKENGE